MVPNPKRMGDPDEYGILAGHICDNDFLNGTTITNLTNPSRQRLSTRMVAL